jgi:thioredoxin-like negative regulator of GroEL
MGEAAQPTALALVDGRVVLTIADRTLGPTLADRVEVEWPGVGALPSPAPDGLRNKPGRLRLASVFVDLASVQRSLAAATLPAQGISRLGISIEKDRIVLAGRVEAGGREADFTARLALEPAGDGAKLRVGVEDVRVHGAPPLPIAAIASGVLAALHVPGAPAGAAADTAVEIDPLTPLLDELLVADGWRLPQRGGIACGPVTVLPKGIGLSWSTGESAAEAAQRLAAARERAGDDDGAIAALRACLDAGATGGLAAAAWRRLVEIHARRGDPQAAARALIASADDARTGAAEPERAANLLAAAEILRRRLNLPADAGMLLERAASLDPRSGEVLAALESMAAESGDEARLADVLERQLEVVTRGPVEQREILLRLAALYEGTLNNADRAKQTRERLRDVHHGMEETPMPAAIDSGARTTAELEAQLSSDPADPATAEELAGRYNRIDDPTDRAEALSGLLRRAVGLTDEQRKSLYAALGESAEAGGDLDRAEQAYWRAAQIEAEPGLRANFLCARARVLLARGDIETASGELDEALARAPGHPGATALLAEVSFRAHDWPRARALYAALEASPAATDIIPREALVHRRALLAQRTGDPAEAEALFRELAILNPLQVDARRALAELARARGDLDAATQRLEEVLRLLGGDAPGELVDVRQRLGVLYAERGEWDASRYYLELVMAQDPGRGVALELLAEAYERLEHPALAAEACGRLARVQHDPSRRAAALFRQAELLRTRLGDAAGALDAYLRSSDIDPKFVPARLRLVDHFWTIGDLDVVADLANDLAAVPLSPDKDPHLVARLAIATANPRGGVVGRFAFAPPPAPLYEATLAAILDAAAYQSTAGTRGAEALDPMLARVRGWTGPSAVQTVIEGLRRLLLEDPARPGAALALGRLAELRGRTALAGAAYGLGGFLAPDGPAARAADAVTLTPVTREAVRIGGPVDHPDICVPARRALARLASPMLGYATNEPAPKPTEGSGLSPSRAGELRRIGDLIDAPPFVVVRDAMAAGITDERRRLRVIPTHPAGLMIAPAAADLSEKAWAFVTGRALETLRSGLRTAGLISGEGLPRLTRILTAARVVLLEGMDGREPAPPLEDPETRAIADWLRTPDAALSLGTADMRAETLAEVEATLANPPDWGTFTRGAQHTRNRIGLLACGNAAEALNVLRGEDRNGPLRDTPAARLELLRGVAARALVEFMFSPTYEQAFSPPPPSPSASPTPRAL